MKRLIPLLIGTILCCASHLDHDLAFLEVVPDVRHQRPITANYWSHHDELMILRCGVTHADYRYSWLLYRLGRIRAEEINLRSVRREDLNQWGL